MQQGWEVGIFLTHLWAVEMTLKKLTISQCKKCTWHGAINPTKPCRNILKSKIIFSMTI